MKILACLFLLLPLCVEIHALDLNEEGQKLIDKLSKELQKSKVIKVGPRLFNREVTSQMRPKDGDLWIGIVGDSSVTGAASHPDFRATMQGVLGAATKHFNPQQGLLSPIRVMYTAEEFKQAERNNQAFELNVQSDLSQKVDTEEYSAGYILARTMGFSPNSIVMAAQDGARIGSMYNQMLRLFAVGSPALPPIVLVSYVANDLCPQETFTEDVEKFRASYEQIVHEQFEKVAQLPAPTSGTRIFILEPLDLVNVLANPDLLSQKVPLEGHKDVSCEELRSGKFGNDFTKAMQSSLRGQCPGLFNLTNNPGRHLGRTRDLQVVQSQVLSNAIDDFNRRPNSRISMVFARSTRTIDFSSGDLGNDCFHPSLQGAGKIALELRRNELKDVH